MARVLSQTLIPKTARSPLLFRASRLLTLRGRSYSTEKGQLVEIDLGEAEEEPDLVGGVRMLEDAIHRVIVQRSAPAWLPFLPGSSYWVPPRRKVQSHPGMVELIERIANPMSEEETMSLWTSRGWPASAYFMEGLPPHPVEGNPEETAVKSDCDET